ncbi:MAG: hypothetical protein WKF87_09625 [Chryseolinea sp.]
MKKHEKPSEQLRMILKGHGMLQTSEAYSKHLEDLVIDMYAKNQSVKFAGNRGVAQIILGMSILWGILFLYFYNPLSVHPVLCISIVAFVVGLWGVIAIVRKGQMPPIPVID